MADIRTMKDGRLYLLKDGSSSDDFASADALSGCLFQKTDGKWAALVEQGGDLFKFDGGTAPSSIQTSTPAASINPANPAQKPVVYNDGSRLHCWYGYDESSAGAYDLRYLYSDNDGSSWSSPVDLGIRGEQTWCNTAVWPLAFRLDDLTTNIHSLVLVGYDGTDYTVGVATINTAAGGFNTDVDDPTKYLISSANSSWLDVFSKDTAAFYHEGAWYACDRSGSGISLFRSFDRAQTWDVLNDSAATRLINTGVSGALDDTTVYPFSVVYEQGAFHMLYGGNDGSATRAKLAVGESLVRLTKVPWMDVDTFGSSDLLVSYSSELTFDASDLTTHVSNRGHPGSLVDAPFAPQPISFTARLTGEMGDATGAFSWLADSSISPQVGQDSVAEYILQLSRLNVVYVTEDSAGDPAEFYLFPDVAFNTVSVAEGADGITINASGVMHSMRRPLFGGMS